MMSESALNSRFWTLGTARAAVVGILSAIVIAETLLICAVGLLWWRGEMPARALPSEPSIERPSALDRPALACTSAHSGDGIAMACGGDGIEVDFSLFADGRSRVVAHRRVAPGSWRVTFVEDLGSTGRPRIVYAMEDRE